MRIPGPLRPPRPRRQRQRSPEDWLREEQSRRGAPDGSSPGVWLFRRAPQTVLALLLLLVAGGLLLGQLNVSSPDQEGLDARTQIALRELRNLRLALDFFEADCGRYPSEAEGLKALVQDPGIAGWNGPYVNWVRPDPWKQPYRYRLRDGEPEIASNGPDRKQGTRDDVHPFARLAAANGLE